MATNDPLLSVRNLSCGHGRNSVLAGIAFDVKRGEVLGLVGPNGCGKSTLLKTLVGLHVAKGGSIEVMGKGIGEYSSKERARHVALMPQNLSATYLSAMELARCGARAGGHAKDSLEQVAVCAVQRAGVWEVKKRSVFSLSGGQRQKAYLAMMLAQDPEILLLDEPTSALDVGSSHEVLKLVASLAKEEGKAAVVVIHDLDLALRYCDRLAVIDEGSLRCVGSVGGTVLHAVEESFGVRASVNDGEWGRSYSFFPK